MKWVTAEATRDRQGVVSDQSCGDLLEWPSKLCCARTEDDRDPHLPAIRVVARTMPRWVRDLAGLDRVDPSALTGRSRGASIEHVPKAPQVCFTNCTGSLKPFKGGPSWAVRACGARSPAEGGPPSASTFDLQSGKPPPRSQGASHRHRPVHSSPGLAQWSVGRARLGGTGPRAIILTARETPRQARGAIRTMRNPQLT